MKNRKKEIKSALPVDVLNRLEEEAEIAGTSVQNVILEAVLAYLDAIDKAEPDNPEYDGKEYIAGWRDGREEGFDKGFEAGEAHAFEVIMRRVRSEQNAMSRDLE